MCLKRALSQLAHQPSLSQVSLSVLIERSTHKVASPHCAGYHHYESKSMQASLEAQENMMNGADNTGPKVRLSSCKGCRVSPAARGIP